MSTILVLPTSLLAPADADSVAAELLTAASRALHRSVADTGRADSAEAVSSMVRGLTAEADGLARAALEDAVALRAAIGAYVGAEQSAMER